MDGYTKLFSYYKQLGEKAIAQVKDEALFWTPNANSNSISVIVQHLRGNMLSRWTDFLTSDGEKKWRDRDGEFESRFRNREEVISAWEEGWKCLFDALDSINNNNRDQLVYIRDKGHSIDEAIQRQLAHYSYHVGQIVFLSRILADSWESLSIPKGGSAQFNMSAREPGQRKEHFTSQFLENNKD